MKKLFLMAICLFSFTLLTSCGGGSPKSVAEDIISCLEDGDKDGLKEYINFEADATDEQKEALAALLIAGWSTEMESATVVEEKIAEDGKTAEVKVESVKKNGEKDTDTWEFVNVDGEWKCDF